MLTCSSVESYHVKDANLRLKHKYPATSAAVVANVNIQHILEQIKTHETDVGTWINVLGYVERRKELGIFVQAIAAWDAGNVDLDAYEKAISGRTAKS